MKKGVKQNPEKLDKKQIHLAKVSVPPGKDSRAERDASNSKLLIVSVTVYR